MNNVTKGFSLIELLIAMSLLLMITSLGSYGYGLYAKYWQQNVGHFESTLQEVKGVSTLFRVLDQMKPYILKNDKDSAFYYFEGSKSVIRSTIKSAFSDPSNPAAFELKVVDVGGFQRLIYSETVFNALPPIRKQDIRSYDFEIVLLEGFDNLFFEFYGPENFDTWLESEPLNSIDSSKWYGYYSGEDTKLIPQLVKIVIEDEKGRSSLRVALPSIMKKQLTAYFLGDA
jgi:prepilin-type N-terminal cleavage/methylation domain-containing protein